MTLSKFRTSSCNLEIERGRYTRPKLNVDQRLCMSCNVVEDEEHIVFHCQDNRAECKLFLQNLDTRYSFLQLSAEQYVFRMRCSDPQILAWLGKFIQQSFLNRSILRNNACTRWGQGLGFIAYSSLAAAFDDMWGWGCRFDDLLFSSVYS